MITNVAHVITNVANMTANVRPKFLDFQFLEMQKFAQIWPELPGQLPGEPRFAPKLKVVFGKNDILKRIVNFHTYP